MPADGSRRVVLVALACSVVAAAAKFAAAGWTGSAALLSEAVHSLVDASNQALLLVGIGRARRPADARHPFGYGREIYFWSFIVAILLFGLGAGVSIYEGIEKLAQPLPMRDPGAAYLALGLGLAVTSLSTWRAVSEGSRRGFDTGLAALRSSRDPTLFTVVLADIAALVGLAVALAGIVAADRFGAAEADGMASIAIGLVMAAVAVLLSIEIQGHIIGEATHPSVRDGLRVLVAAETGDGRPIRRINDIHTMHLGPDDVLVVASCDFHDHETARGVEATAARIERAVTLKYPQVKRLYIEVRSPDGRGSAVASNTVRGGTGHGDEGAPQQAPQVHPTSHSNHKGRKGRRRGH